MVDASLHLDGSYRAPGSDAAIPFALHTAVANGGLFDRVTTTTAPLHVDTGQAATRVTVRRHLGALFTGVDFSTMQDGVLAEQILKSLIDHVEVEIAALG